MSTRITACLLGALLSSACGGESPIAQGESAHTEIPCTSHEAAPGSPRAYFAPFDPVEHEVLCLLDRAQTEVVVAHYNIRRESYLNKLVELKDRGVDVRVAVDAGNAAADYNVGDDFLEAHGIPLVRTRPSSSALMHLKVSVIDQSYAMTGSFNWNGTAALANDENMIVFREPAVVDAYRQEVLEVLGEESASDQGGQLTDEVSLHFVPEVRADTIIIEQIEAARHSIDIAMFTLTHDPVRDALIDALEDPSRDVRVRLVIEGDRAGGDDADIEAAGGLVIRQPNRIGEFSAMHQKYAVFDGERVISGATNWTFSGTRRNAEDLLVLSDPELVARYQKNFADLLAVYGELEDDVTGADDTSPTLFNAIAGDTEWGELIAVTGDHPALGSWDPWQGVKMDTSTSMFPSWTGTVPLPAGTRVEFKYVLLSPSGAVRWEPGPNRVLVTPATGRAFVTSGAYGDTSDNRRPSDP